MLDINKINQYINSILDNTPSSDTSTLYVIAGAPSKNISIQCDYLFSRVRTHFNEYLNKSDRQQMISEIVAAGSALQKRWCRIEDFLLIGETIIKEYFEVYFVKLPVFRRIIPFEIDIQGLARQYSTEEDELSSEWFRPVIIDEAISKELVDSLGSIYEFGSDFFIPLPEGFAWENQDFNFEIQQETGLPEVEFTLTEDEGSWIQLYTKLRFFFDDPVVIHVFISSEFLEKEYSQTMLWMSWFTNCILRKKDEESHSVQTDFNTLEILKEYWKITKYRDFYIYRNVRHNSNIKVEKVSQVNVINDLLTQTHWAQIGKPYRDIFVTAPTGSGKSLMFQIPSIILHKQQLITLIISPLIALMNDQVYSLKSKGLAIAATINSSISLSERAKIIDDVKSGKVSILYLSPESLLSRSEISELIGERKVGLLVIDEAHIVTTWGKGFRPDYWYLGNYIQRIRKEHNFPIATFTATAIYMGSEDMYSETRDSLGMRDPITYFGYIPRDNIQISFEKNSDFIDVKTKEYNEVKFSVLASRLAEFLQDEKKTLVYFPFVSLINDFQVFVASREVGFKNDQLAIYHGNISQREKHENFLKFRSNDCSIMLATKAFGMGVDIPDIDVVYHYAPTGNVCDYIQEIGRVARNEDIMGIAKFDYLMKDFRFVQQLYGISSITKYELFKVIKKVIEIGKNNDYRRNLLISSDDFQLIFSNSTILSDKDSSSLDNKIKTALLIIEKDFILKLGYSPIVARPRALFTYGYFRASGANGLNELQTIFSRYQEDIGECFKINLKKFWENEYPNLSFALFKYKLYTNPIEFGFSNTTSLIPIVIVNIKQQESFLSTSIQSFIEVILAFCSQYFQNGKFFKKEMVENYLKNTFTGLNGIRCTLLAEAILIFLDTWNRSIDLNYGKFLTFREESGYRITSTGYQDIRDFFNRLDLSSDQSMYLESGSSERKKISRLFALLGLFENAELLTYTIQGGDNPEIFIRINSYFQLQNTIQNYSKYENIILENVQMRHENSVRFLEYLFTNITNETDRFWCFIESYFLGFQPDFSQNIDQNLVQIDKAVVHTT